MRQAVIFSLLAKGFMFIMLGMAAVIFARHAKASEFAYAPNKAGGELILTDERGKCPQGWNVILARTSEGDVQSGCWTVKGKAIYIQVLWDNGQPRLYLLNDFTIFESNIKEVTYE